MIGPATGGPFSLAYVAAMRMLTTVMNYCTVKAEVYRGEDKIQAGAEADFWRGQ